MQEKDLKRLHDTLVEILDYIVAICEEHKLTYMLLYGTLLGAHRHGGFIPWDDDLDIAMPRDDYEKLIKILNNKKLELYELQYEKNEKKYYLQFVKIRKKGTTFIEEIAKGMYDNNGIFIDIIPLDFAKDKNSFTHKMRLLITTYLKHILRYSSYKGAYDGKRGVVGNIAEHIICIPAYILPKKFLLKILNNMCKGKCQRKEAKYIVEYTEERHKSTNPIDIFFPTKNIEFCGKTYQCPNKVEKYLEIAYGSTYMQLPPVEKRCTHTPIELKF